LSDFNEI